MSGDDSQLHALQIVADLYRTTVRGEEAGGKTCEPTCPQCCAQRCRRANRNRIQGVNGAWLQSTGLGLGANHPDQIMCLLQ